MRMRMQWGALLANLLLWPLGLWLVQKQVLLPLSRVEL